jgi:hypothetical protein
LSLPSARRPPVLCINGGRAVQARTHGAKGLAIASQFADKRRCFARPLIRAGAKLSLLHRLAEVHSAYWECHVLKARSARGSSFSFSELYRRRSLTRAHADDPYCDVAGRGSTLAWRASIPPAPLRLQRRIAVVQSCPFPAAFLSFVRLAYGDLLLLPTCRRPINGNKSGTWIKSRLSLNREGCKNYIRRSFEITS